MSVERHTRSEVRTKARNAAEPLDDLIRPSDVDDDAESWDEVDDDALAAELHQATEIICGESQRPYAGYAHDLAVQLTRDAMLRVPMDVRVYDDRAEAGKHGYWPNRMDRYRVTELIEEHRHGGELAPIWVDSHRDAWEVVSEGIFEGMKPSNTDA